MKLLLLKILIISLFVCVSDNIMANILMCGLSINYGLDKKASVLFVGHSRTDLGIDEKIIENNIKLNTVKYSYGGANVFDRYAMIKNYFSRNPAGTVKYVVYDVDYQIFSRPEKLSVNSYKKLYPFMDIKCVSEYLKASAKNNEEYFSRQIIKMLRYDSGALNLSLKTLIFGKTQYGNNKIITENDIENYKKLYDKNEINFDNRAYKCFTDTIAYIKDNGAKFIIIKSALPDFVIEKHIEEDKYSDKIFKQVSNEDDGVIFIDFSKSFSDKYSLFQDVYHLNRCGQVEFSNIISQNLSKIIEAWK